MLRRLGLHQHQKRQPAALGQGHVYLQPLEREGIEGPGEVTRLAASVWSPFMHSVSLTGGEPLLQSVELQLLLPQLKEEGMPIYLETNGTLYEALEAVLPWVDFIAMDVKLPSSQEGRDLIEEQRRFLRGARARRLYLKAVVDEMTEERELEHTCRILSGETCDVPFVLQPATPMRGEGWVTVQRISDLCRVAAAFFPDVRVIPQAHRVWGVR